MLQHVGCCWLTFDHFQTEPATPNVSQHITTGWPNTHNMLRPTMLRYVALTRCDRLAGLYAEANICCIFYSDNVADITHALQRLTEAPHVATLSTAVSRATSRISAMSERSSQEFPIPGKLLHEILKV